MWLLFQINCFSTVLAGIFFSILGFYAYHYLFKKEINQKDIKQESTFSDNLNIANVNDFYYNTDPVPIISTKNNLSVRQKLKKKKNKRKCDG